MFDSVRLEAELSHIHHALGMVAASSPGKGLIDGLRGAARGPTSAIIELALVADCLRVVHGAMAADGAIGDQEIDALFELITRAARHYAAAVPAGYGAFAVIDRRTARAFLDHYAADRGSFGRGAVVHWPGLELCRRAAEVGAGDALARYEQVMAWLIAEACGVGGVVVNDPKWTGRVDELDELRRTLPRLPGLGAQVGDRRVHAFLTHTGIFTAVQHPTSIFENDPFDVETVHREARESFEQLVKRARTPSPVMDRGRMLLMLGESGCGKTHVLRGFRRHVHEYGRGFVAYAQLQSSSENYARYLLQHVVNSLARPYSGPSGGTTGLQELAQGLIRLASEPLQARVQRLVDDAWQGNDGLTQYVEDLANDLLCEGELASFDPDLLRVMLYALCPDPRRTSRVYRYLRCEDMSPADRRWIGDAVPRTDKDHPHVMIKEIGRLASMTQRVLVLMVDQADFTGYDISSGKMFCRVVDALYSVVSEVPSAIAVISCLSDVYETVKNELSRPALDRLEKDPETVRLRLNRSYPEIEAIVGKRLAWLYAEQRAVYRPETPVYPIPVSALRDQTNRRTRDVLEWCHQYQAQCFAAGKILDGDQEAVILEPSSPELDLPQIAAAWNDARCAEGISVPDDDDDEILGVIATAAQAYVEDTGIELVSMVHNSGALHVKLSSGTERAELVIGVTNNSYHRGSFAGQVEALRNRAGAATAVAIRTLLPFPRGESSNKVMEDLVAAGGRGIHVDDSTLRELAALQRFQPPFSADRVAAWRRRDRPIASLSVVASIFRIEPRRVQASIVGDAGPEIPPAPIFRSTPPAEPAPAESNGAPISPVARSASKPTRKRSGQVASPAPAMSGVAASSPLPSSEPTPVSPPPETQPSPEPGRDATTSPPQPPGTSRNERRGGRSGPRAASVPPIDTVSASEPPSGGVAPQPVTRSIPTGPLCVGSSTSLSAGGDAAPRELEIDALANHVAIVGGRDCGGSELARSLIEQLLDRDVAVIAIDRGGDLSGYARPDWWQHASDPGRARSLAERMDARLFTPGASTGRPLALPVAPDLECVAETERDAVIRSAAASLAGIMQCHDAEPDAAELALLTQAISVLAARAGNRDLADLIALMESRDADLLARVGHQEDRLDRLARHLQTVQQREPLLFDRSAEVLSLDTLTGRAAGGKVPLAIVNLRGLGDLPRVRPWFSYLIACLSRPSGRPGGGPLHTALVIDDAELFLPAGAAKTATKDPLQVLLKQASHTGLGIVLSSQNPAALDYRCHGLIHTWFVGKIDAAALDRMKPMLENRPPMNTKLLRLERGRFVMLHRSGFVDLQCVPSLVRPEPFTDEQLLALAAQTRPPLPSPRPRQGRTPRARTVTPRPSAS